MTKYYAVRNGRQQGVYSNWNDCKAQVSHFSGAEHKSFATKAEAVNYLQGGSSNDYSGGYSYGGSSGSSYGGYSGYGGGYGGGSSQPQAKTSNSSRNSSHPQREVSVYTDGSSLSNGTASARAGYGVFWGDDHPDNKSGRVDGPSQTNNRGELMAIHDALGTITEKHEPGVKYTIYSDSKYAMNSIGKWGDTWESNGWTKSGGPIKNLPLIQSVRNQIDDLSEQGVSVSMEYVPGHKNVYGNEMADSLARSGAAKPQ